MQFFFIKEEKKYPLKGRNYFIYSSIVVSAFVINIIQF